MRRAATESIALTPRAALEAAQPSQAGFSDSEHSATGAEGEVHLDEVFIADRALEVEKRLREILEGERPVGGYRLAVGVV